MYTLYMFLVVAWYETIKDPEYRVLLFVGILAALIVAIILIYV